jgi:hypothetical protein
MKRPDKMMMTPMGFGKNELAIIHMAFEDLMQVKILSFGLRYQLEFPC